MSTTTVRIRTETHAHLVELSRASGASLLDTMHEAAEALGRRRFGHRVSEEIAALRADPIAWQAYLDEAESTTVADGLG